MQNRIESLRTSRGWTQRDLASRAGTSQARVSAAENGVDVRTSTALAIAAAFELPVAEVFGHFRRRRRPRRARSAAPATASTPAPRLGGYGNKSIEEAPSAAEQPS